MNERFMQQLRADLLQKLKTPEKRHVQELLGQEKLRIWNRKNRTILYSEKIEIILKENAIY